jgi:TatD DNase family protein
LICVGCDEKSSRQSVEIAGQFENVYAAVGVHPTEVGSLSSLGPSGSLGVLGFLHHFLHEHNEPKRHHEPFPIVAIGETGLDYFHQPFDREAQISVFREQCLIAKEYNLPVIVHLRMTQHSKDLSSPHELLNRAERDCLSVLDETGMKSGKVLFHCFSSDRTMAEEVLKRGWHLSFSGVITFPRAGELREVVMMCPLDSMVVETDAPFLAPRSHRGQRNEPAYVVETARQIAELKGVSDQDLNTRLDANAEKFFRLP